MSRIICANMCREAVALPQPSPAGVAAPKSPPKSSSQPQPFPGPFNLSDPECVDLLRKVLDRAGFSEANVRNAVADPNSRLQLKRIDFPLYERRLAEVRPLHTFIKLFMMQLWVKPSDVEAGLAPLDLKRLVALGLLETGTGGVHSRCAFSLCNGLIVAHDRVELEDEDPRADHVLGVNPSAFTLANLTVRRPVERALDIGTGSGIQALLASQHSRHVVATDTNPRALNYLAFNARVNGIRNIECRLGNLFEPVKGCRFDLITCNPPYVISPDTHYVFRDSGLPGDLICEQVVRQAPAHLEPGGYACVLCNWAHRKEEEWSNPVRRWVEDSCCDTWVLRGATEDPLAYAAAWTRAGIASTYAAALDRWREYYDRSGIEALSMGAVLLRRRNDAHGWFRADDWPAKPSDNCSDQILRIFQAEDYARTTAEPASLQHRFALAGEHSLRQELKYRQGELICLARQLVLERGLRFQCNLDAHSLCLIAQCDGSLTLSEAIAALSRTTGVPVEQIQSRAIDVVRQLVAYGFLLPIFGAEVPTVSRRVAGLKMAVPNEPNSAGREAECTQRKEEYARIN